MLNYTDLAEEIVGDVAEKVAGLSHIDPSRIAIAAAGRWAGTSWGNLATCMSLTSDREATFAIWTRGRSKKVVAVTPWVADRSVEIEGKAGRCLYLILLRLPRVLEHDPLETLVHELFHINPKFDGSLRAMRHGKLFDWNVKKLMREWLAAAEPGLAERARMSLDELRAKMGAIVARRVPVNFRSMLTLAAEAPCSYEEGIERFYPGHRLARRYEVHRIDTTPERCPRNVRLDEFPLRLYDDAGSEDLTPTMRRYLERGQAARMGP